MQILQQLDSDVTAELFATLLFEGNEDLSLIILDRLGGNMRPQTKDVHKVRQTAGQYYHDKLLTVIESYRESLYEELPEYFFHPPTLGGMGTPVDEVVEEIKKQNKVEEDARKFFKPFEQESLYLQMMALNQELVYEKKSLNGDLLNLFKQGWPIIQKLPADCALPFIYILPILYHVKGNKDWTEKCISYITGLPVTITDDYEPLRIDRSLPGFVVGKSRLNIDTSIGGQLTDGLFEWKIAIGPVPQHYTANVLPGSGFEELVNYLIECFTPIQVNASWHIVTQKEGDTFLDNSDKNAARLGYSFYL
ncbi:hypothetical protein QEG73_22940 [Chitinophagaceae bacterium 26-R-25]|nr:hypothetical protein [Chitinophagaceae bacterium 26-R-25]